MKFSLSALTVLALSSSSASAFAPSPVAFRTSSSSPFPTPSTSALEAEANKDQLKSDWARYDAAMERKKARSDKLTAPIDFGGIVKAGVSLKKKKI